MDGFYSPSIRCLCIVSTNPGTAQHIAPAATTQHNTISAITTDTDHQAHNFKNLSLRMLAFQKKCLNLRYKRLNTPNTISR